MVIGNLQADWLKISRMSRQDILDILTSIEPVRRRATAVGD
jgi:hypothetical protein